MDMVKLWVYKDYYKKLPTYRIIYGTIKLVKRRKNHLAVTIKGAVLTRTYKCNFVTTA